MTTPAKKTVGLYFRVREDLGNQLKTLATQERLSQTGWLERAIERAHAQLIPAEIGTPAADNTPQPCHRQADGQSVTPAGESPMNGVNYLPGRLRVQTQPDPLYSTVLSLLQTHQILIDAICSRPSVHDDDPDESLAIRQLFHVLEDSRKALLTLMQSRTTTDHPFGDYELWRDRKDKQESPIDFLRRVWGKYIDAGLLFQSDLKGQNKTQSNPNPRKGLDKTLYGEITKYCKAEGKRVSDYLPNYSGHAANRRKTGV